MRIAIHRRDAENAEGAQRYFELWILLRALCSCVFAIYVTFQIAALLACVVAANAYGELPSLQETALLRIAVIGFTRKAINYDERDARMLEGSLSDSLKSNVRASLVERNLFQPALAGLGYEGSINLSREEARRIGAAVGCDFFITGKAEMVTRSQSKDEKHIEAIIGVMIVDGRSGELAHFDFIEEKADTSEIALNKAAAVLKASASLYVQRMMEWRKYREVLKLVVATTPDIERVEEIPEEGTPQSAGFKPPEFLSRVKPEYTHQAESADISATVEASVIFQSAGTLREIEITRWAGFGLDESSIEAIRQLKFKPATRDGKPVSIRATVQYNFRRVER